MSAGPACVPCRTRKAKVSHLDSTHFNYTITPKCDRVRPVCGRCAERKITCSGLPADEAYLFRDENAIAQRNSQRARREHRSTSAVSFDLTPSAQSRQQSPKALTDSALQSQYYWLNDQALSALPNHVKLDTESRALDRFFVNWTLYPSNEGMSIGHMYDLHHLYQTAPNGSLLTLVVKAMAFADLKSELSTEDANFQIKARQSYGAALQRLRAMANEEQKLTNEHVLAAILLLDNFESVYLARVKPLGPHRDAIKHILYTDREEYPTESQFSLWCVAHQRLQVRQLLARDPPDPEQVTWVDRLNTRRPDLHIAADMLHMNTMSAELKNFIRAAQETLEVPEYTILQAQQLASSTQDLITTVETWSRAVAEQWKPKQLDADQEVLSPIRRSSLPIPHFPCPKLLNYHDLWLAYMWNLHAAAQIVLRESLIELIDYIEAHSEQAPDLEGMTQIHQDQAFAVEQLSSAIVRSLPQLTGFKHRHESNYTPHRGKMTGRLFALCSLRVVQQANWTSEVHKKTADEIVEWMRMRHGLD